MVVQKNASTTKHSSVLSSCYSSLLPIYFDQKIHKNTSHLTNEISGVYKTAYWSVTFYANLAPGKNKKNSTPAIAQAENYLLGITVNV